MAFARGGLLGIATLVLYIWLAPEHIVDGDNAEFSTLAALGGTAHPTGYPAYVLWLRAWSWLPADNAAHAASIATAILGALQMVVLVHAARAWGASVAAANAAVLVFAGSPVVLAIYTEAEVFAANGLVASLVLWLAAQRGPLVGGWRCAALGLVAGVGLAAHVTCALLAPIGILGVVRGIRESRPRAALLAIGGLVVGLTPYLYLLVAPEHEGTWGKPETLGDVLHVFLRSDFGGPTAFAPRDQGAQSLANLVAFGETFARTWLWVPGIAALVAFGVRISRPAPNWQGIAMESRAAWIALAASFVIAGPLLVLRFNLDPDEGIERYVVERFHLLPLLVLVIPVAIAFDVVVKRIRVRVAIAVLGFGVAFAGVVALSLPHVFRVHVPALHQMVRNTFRSLPPNAIVIGAGDDLKLVGDYLRLVEGVRPDVTYVHWPMASIEWARARWAKHGITFTRGEGVASVAVAERAMALGRPVFVDILQGNVIKELPHYPYGILYRVLPRGSQVPPLDEIFRTQQDVFSKFEITYPRPRKGDRWPYVVHVKYAWAWQQLARALNAAGKREEAAWAVEAAREIGPAP